MAKIFVSYRRDDSSGYAGRLVKDLNDHFGPEQVFQDIQAIEAGEDFVEALDQAVGSCVVLLVFIGPRWLSATDSNAARRLDDPHDFVRLEISSALRRSIRVIPVLVQGATMPNVDDLTEELQPLARRQAHEISDKRWEYDVGKLIESLEKIPELKSRTVSTESGDSKPVIGETPARPGLAVGKLAAGGIGVAVVALAIFLYSSQEQPLEEDLASMEVDQYEVSPPPIDAIDVEGKWVLSDSDPEFSEIWQISGAGNDLQLEIRERQSGLVVGGGTGALVGDTIEFNDLTIDQRHAYADLTLTGDGEALEGEIVFDDNKDSPEPVTLTR